MEPDAPIEEPVPLLIHRGLIEWPMRNHDGEQVTVTSSPARVWECWGWSWTHCRWMDITGLFHGDHPYPELNWARYRKTTHKNLRRESWTYNSPVL